MAVLFISIYAANKRLAKRGQKKVIGISSVGDSESKEFKQVP